MIYLLFSNSLKHIKQNYFHVWIFSSVKFFQLWFGSLLFQLFSLTGSYVIDVECFCFYCELSVNFPHMVTFRGLKWMKFPPKRVRLCQASDGSTSPITTFNSWFEVLWTTKITNSGCKPAWRPACEYKFSGEIFPTPNMPQFSNWSFFLQSQWLRELGGGIFNSPLHYRVDFCGLGFVGQSPIWHKLSFPSSEWRL